MTVFLIALDVAVFLLELTRAGEGLEAFALWPPRAFSPDSPGFHLWQLVTYSTLHASFAHLAFNMLGLFMFGREVERVLGARRMPALCLASIVAGALVQLAVLWWLMRGAAYPTIGASAGVFGALIAYALLFPRRRVVLLFPPPCRCPPGSSLPATRRSNLCSESAATHPRSRILRTLGAWRLRRRSSFTGRMPGPIRARDDPRACGLLNAYASRH